MDFSKIKKISFILLILFIVLFPFWCVRGLCAEVEDVTIENVIGLRITMDSNYFTSLSGASVTTFIAEPGYKYTITTNLSSTRIIVTSSEYPALNGTYDIIGTIDPTESTTYNLIVNNSTQISLNGTSNGYTVQREKLEGMNSTINDLVDNVGINQFWNTFSDAIPMIEICAFFIFGFVIVTFLILKISKGKAGF